MYSLFFALLGEDMRSRTAISCVLKLSIYNKDMSTKLGGGTGVGQMTNLVFPGNYTELNKEE